MYKTTDQILSYMNEGSSNSSSVFSDVNTFERALLLAGTDDREHTIKDFLERPVPMWNGEWKTTNAQFSNLVTIEVPDDVLKAVMYQQKLAGFLGIRAGLKFRLQVNSQPFQAGRLRMIWVPYYKYLGKRTTVWDAINEGSFVSKSSLPGVEIDVSTTTECEFHVPYASPHLFYNLTTGEGYWGKLYVTVYSPLVDPAGGGKVDCNLWFSFEDVQLGFPTGAPAAQSSLSPVAQVGKEEHDMELKRSFSAASSKFASALRSIPPIPYLDSIIQPAAWASDTMSEVLKLFGLSKPESSNIPNYVKSNPLQFMPNSDGVNMSHNLSLLAGNSTELMPDMVSSGVDEMALLHLASTPSYIGHFSWTTSQPSGTSLFTYQVQPTDSVTFDATTVVPSMLYYTSSAFGFWRGSIDLTFKFVKTKFHSGRVRLYFQAGTVTFQTNNRNYNYSQVIDLRSEDVVKFRVPYISTKPWMLVDSAYNGVGGYPFCTGVVKMEVLNELMATSTVSNTIDVLVEVSAGPDFELAGPRAPILTPVIVKPKASLTEKLIRTSRTITAQIGQEESREEEQAEIVNKEQLGVKRNMAEWINVLAMHGERVMSVRQMIKRSSRVAEIKDPSTDLLIAPFQFNINYMRETDVAAGSYKFQNYLSHFLNLYAFWRGSVNLKIIPREQITNKFKANGKFNLSVDVPPTYPSITRVIQATPVTVKGANGSGGPEQIIINDLEGCIDITCPYYSQYHMSPITDYTFRSVNVELGMFPPYLVNLSNMVASKDYDVYRCAADSFQMGYVLGPPICERS